MQLPAGYRGLRTAVTASALAAIVALAPLPGIQPAAASEPPDLTAIIVSSEPNSTFQTGAPLIVGVRVHNGGGAPAKPATRMVLPSGFTDVRLEEKAKPYCQISPPSSSASGFQIACNGIPFGQGGGVENDLWPDGEWYLRVGAKAPQAPGKYLVTAVVSDTYQAEVVTNNNSNSATLTVLPPGGMAVPHPKPIDPAVITTPSKPGVTSRPREGICLLKKC